MVPHSVTGLHLAMTRQVALMSFRLRRDAGWMRGSRLSILKSKRWTPQIRRRAAITVSSNPLFSGRFPSGCGSRARALYRYPNRPSMMIIHYTINPPMQCLWQAPASTQKTKRKTRPAIRRSAR